ncbi:MAG: hypothetical protein KHY77_06605 [Butyricicoccus pullicaecorum]|nr:hypothetical protein [Butyricicoccus pullicaecorum]
MFPNKQIRQYITPQRVLISGLIIVSSIYLVVQSVKAMSAGVVSTPANYVTIDDSIPAEGWFVRSETVTEGTSSSTVKHIVSNGEKVQAQAALAVVYADETIMDASRRLEEINAELELLNAALQSAGNYTNDNTKTEQQMIVQMQHLSALVEDGMPTGAADTATQLRKLSLRRNASSLNIGELRSQIVALENEKNGLIGRAAGRSTTISAPVSGYFSEVVDGYETVLTPEKLQSMTPEAFHTLTQQKVSPPAGKLGKVMNGFTWQFAAVLDKTAANRLKIGQDVTLKFSQISANVAAKVVSITPDAENKEALVVFSSTTVNGELVSIRQQKVDIVFASYTGLQVPVSAITMNEKSQIGVYILTGNTVRFKNITPIYKGSESYIVEKGMTNSDLVIGDAIITQATGLSDLKVMK